MQKYRVKNRPNVKVEAEQLTAENVDRLANICQGQIVEEGRSKPDQEAINVKTPNGRERLHQGMYLVKVGENFYTASAVNFEMRYELDRPLVDVEAPEPFGYPATDDPWKGVPRIKDVP